MLLKLSKRLSVVLILFSPSFWARGDHETPKNVGFRMWDGVGSRVGRETVVSMGHLNCDWGGSNGAFVNSGLDVMGWLRKMTEKPSWWDVSKEGFGITSVVLLSGAGLGKTYFGEGRFHSWVGMLQDSRWWQWGGRSWSRVAHYWPEPQGSGV